MASACMMASRCSEPIATYISLSDPTRFVPRCNVPDWCFLGPMRNIFLGSRMSVSVVPSPDAVGPRLESDAQNPKDPARAMGNIRRRITCAIAEDGARWRHKSGRYRLETHRIIRGGSCYTTPLESIDASETRSVGRRPRPSDSRHRKPKSPASIERKSRMILRRPKTLLRFREGFLPGRVGGAKAPNDSTESYIIATATYAALKPRTAGSKHFHTRGTVFPSAAHRIPNVVCDVHTPKLNSATAKSSFRRSDAIPPAPEAGGANNPLSPMAYNIDILANPDA